MTPLGRRKLWYLLRVVGTFVALVAIIELLIDPHLPLIVRPAMPLLVGAFFLLVPGRLHGWACRPLYRAVARLDEERPAEAREAASEAIALFTAEPWRTRLGWMVGLVHSGSVLAMAHYNRAVAHGALGELDLAVADAERATALDPTYAKAWLLQSVLARLQGDTSGRAGELRARAAGLGLAEDDLEGLLEVLSRLLARVEGGT